jgi:hypothetical protein
MPAKISRFEDMETPQWVYNASARASEIRSLKTKQLFGLTGRRTRRWMQIIVHSNPPALKLKLGHDTDFEE